MKTKATKIEDFVDIFTPFPLKEKNEIDNYFVKTYDARGTNAISRITFALNSTRNPFMKILFMGHRGSGKSTELFLLNEMIKSNFEVISFFIQDEVDVGSMTYIDFIVAITSQIIKYIENNDKIELNNSDIDALYNYWREEKIIEETDTDSLEGTLDFSGKLSFLKHLMLKCSGILQTGSESKITIRKKIEPKIGFLIQLLNQVIAKINEQLIGNNGLIFIIEDLDKLTLPVATELFITHRKVVFSIKTKMILTFPIFMAYDAQYNMIKEDIDICQMLSIIKVKDKNGENFYKGINTLKEIVYKRTEHSLIDEDALQFAIMKSGGAIRDLFQIIRESAFEAMEAGHFKIELEDVKNSYKRLKSEYERLIRTEEDVRKLKQIYNDPKLLTSDETLMSLLLRGLVLEYNGERWCGIHPAIEDFLCEKGEINVKQSTN